jgi:YidC/Oxa1 family membrane protein insertase
LEGFVIFAPSYFNRFMDKNSIIGLILIALLIGSYTYFNQPSQEELKAARHTQDSVEAVIQARQHMAANAAAAAAQARPDTLTALNDTAAQDLVKQEWGEFAGAADGTETFSCD